MDAAQKKEGKTMASLSAQFEQFFTHETRTVNGINFHYVIGGQGQPLVLLHGWPQTWYAWRKVMPELAAHYTVIAPDLPGLGQSTASERGYGASVISRDLFQLVSTLGYDQIFLVGHDMGASVAYAYAAQFREHVRRLVILDVPLKGFGLDEHVQKQNLWHFGFFQVPGLAESLVVGRERLLLERFFSLVKDPAALTEEDVDEYVRRYANPDSLRAGFEYYRASPANGQQFQEYSKQKLEMPVLALGGEYSGAGVPFSSLAQVAENVTGGIIARSGHFLPEEQPEAVVQRLESFFSAHQ